MTPPSFVLGVPTEAANSLKAVASEIGEAEPELSEHRYFDGALFTEIVLQLGMPAAGWATLREWIRARARTLQATRIAFDGGEITAMSAKDAERIIDLIDAQRAARDGDV